VEAVETLPDVVAVFKRFHLASLERHVIVDVVCCHGQTWLKLIARNSKALMTDLNGKLLLDLLYCSFSLKFLYVCGYLNPSNIPLQGSH